MKSGLLPIVLWGLLCLVGLKSARAQDPSFSQFYANRPYLSPALVGLDKGITVSAISRVQWFRADQGFRTHALAVELQEPLLKSGFALTFHQDNQGLANLATTSVGFAYSYSIPGPKHNVHFGLQARWAQRRIDWDRLTFSDQLHPIYGLVNLTSAQPLNDRVSYWDVDFGFAWRFDAGESRGQRTLSSSRYIVGFAIHHLPSLFGANQANESFQNLETIVPPRFTFHAGGIIPITFLQGVKNEFAISPNFKFDIQGDNLFNFSQSLQVFTLGANVLYHNLYAGLYYQDRFPFPGGIQHTNAFIVVGGVDLELGHSASAHKLFIGFSVDINTTGLGIEGGNVYELALRYNFADFPGLATKSYGASSKRILDCKSFY